MSDLIEITILGCGSSGGVPRIGNIWGACDPENPKNERTRCSILVERISKTGRTRVLIDSSPDVRTQLLKANIGELDAVLYTHEHADHTHGLDDLRMIAMNQKSRLPIWTDEQTAHSLQTRFAYAFQTPKGSDYPPILDHNLITGDIHIEGAGGRLSFTPFKIGHGRIDVLGFRFYGVAYTPDLNKLYDESKAALRNLKIWIVDCLRYTPHPSHTHLEQTLAWISELSPEAAILTNLHIDLDYETLKEETPDHVTPAYDQMKLTIEEPFVC